MNPCSEEEMNDAFDEKDDLEASYKEYCLKHGKTALLPVADVRGGGGGVDGRASGYQRPQGQDHQGS